ANDVAYGINALGVGGKVLVDGNEPFALQLDADVVEPKVLGIGHAPDSHKHPVAKDGFPPFDLDHALAVADPRGGDPAPEVELQTLPLEELPGLGGDFGVQPEQDAIQKLKDGDLGPKPPP